MTQMETVGPVSGEAEDSVVFHSISDAAEAMALNIYDNWQAYLANKRDSFQAYFGLSDQVHHEAIGIFAELAGLSFDYQPAAIVEEELRSYRDAEHRPVFYRKQNIARLIGSVLQAEIQRSQGQDRDIILYTAPLDPALLPPSYIAGQYIG